MIQIIGINNTLTMQIKVQKLSKNNWLKRKDCGRWNRQSGLTLPRFKEIWQIDISPVGD